MPYPPRWKQQRKKRRGAGRVQAPLLARACRSLYSEHVAQFQVCAQQDAQRLVVAVVHSSLVTLEVCKGVT